MARKVRERMEINWLGALARKHELTLDAVYPLYTEFLDHIFPEIERSTPEERQAAYQRIFDYVEALEPEAEMTVAQGIKVGGLKPTSRSDMSYVRKTMKESGLLAYSAGQSGHFVRRLTDGRKNGNADPSVH